MSTLSTTPRTHTVTLASASAGPFSLPYRLFDTDDVLVYVDGIKSEDWTLSATFSDGVSDDAAITFSDDLPADSVIVIDSALQPIRSQDMLNGPGLVDFWNNEAGRLWSTVADIKRDARRAVRSFDEVEPADFPENSVVKRSATGFVAGPTTTELEAAEANATAAAASAAAAAQSATDAQAAEESLIVNRGDWVTATAYSPSDLVQGVGAAYLGNTYVCIDAHTSDDFATDLSESRWAVFAARGTAGAGTGDLLAANNLSDIPNKPQARTNLGVPALLREDDMASASENAAASQASLIAYVAAQIAAKTAIDNVLVDDASYVTGSKAFVTFKTFEITQQFADSRLIVDASLYSQSTGGNDSDSGSSYNIYCADESDVLQADGGQDLQSTWQTLDTLTGSGTASNHLLQSTILPVLPQAAKIDLSLVGGTGTGWYIMMQHAEIYGNSTTTSQIRLRYREIPTV